MKPETKSLSAQEASLRLSGNDPVLQRLRVLGRPLTRAEYVKLAFPEGEPDPMPGELEAQIQEALNTVKLPAGYNEEGLSESEAWQKHRQSQKPLPRGPKS